MRYMKLYVMSCAVAFAVVFLPPMGPMAEPEFEFPGWPMEFGDRRLTEMPLSSRQKRFIEGFPGKMAKFSDGRRIILFRWVTKATRKVHPASDCFKGLGYSVRPLPMVRDSEGNIWSCTECTLEGETLRVRERILDTAAGTWTDVSAWYWAALLGRTPGPWWTVTLVERMTDAKSITGD